MAVKRGQRIGIWIIAAFMVVGTIGSFAIIVLANSNAQRDQTRFNELYSQYQKEGEAYQAKLTTQTGELSDKYFETFNQYSSVPAEFDAGAVKELEKKDLVVGDGETLTAESTFTAYYIGWNPTGKVFDGSIADGALKAPLEVTPGSVIQGWSDGVVGMKVGGVREIAIPSDLAYGETGSGEDIPANTPIKFVVMIIPATEKLEQPAMSNELITLYSRLYGQN